VFAGFSFGSSGSNVGKLQPNQTTEKINMEYHLPTYFLTDIVSTVAFGIVAILLIIVGYAAFDKLTPKLDFSECLNKGNIAMGIVIGSFILGLCFVVGRVVSAILGG